MLQSDGDSSAEKNRMHLKSQILELPCVLASLRLMRSGKKNRMLIANSGSGVMPSKNIRERLERRYKEDFILEIKSEVGKGTTVILELPCEEK